MKKYVGTPGNPPIVVIQQKGKPNKVLPHFPGDKRPFGWEDMTTGGHGSSAIAKAILYDALDQDEIQANEFHMRFKHRKIRDFKAVNPWSISVEEVLKIIEQIKESAAAMQPGVQMAAQQPAPFVSDTGGGPGGVPIEWDKTKKELPDEAKHGAENTNKTGNDRPG